MSIINLRNLSVIAGVALITGITAKTVKAATLNDAPLFKDVASYSTTISANNDPVDIYFPNPSNLETDNYSFPVALLLQGANVDKSDYSDFANTVASYGFIVVVPNHQQSLPQFNFTGLLPQTSQIQATLAQMVAENLSPASPVAGIVDTDKLGLLGHSAGGAVGLSAIANLCLPVLCDGSFNRPDELKAGAFFGANLRNQTTGEFIPINNSGIPTALLQGSNDGRATPNRALTTYEQIQDPPKALINIFGANHYGMTNTNNPTGPIPDANTPTIPQDVAVETVARWSGQFLRASILDDPNAFEYVYRAGDTLDSNVSVTSQATPVPEASSTIGLVLLGAGGAFLRLNKRK